ncbi:branched-chain amino acid ABC transporter permease [Streptacidiphilus fuscans]|uniref:Branched-chain amino acid ABC transporter permease n=1 Tax=Streptacidiphilus fuscans TaxID=2789292 RepID=A0A931FDN6_9ACTN|nr:branched-chain amino acid ABC transporter permease [Streptacidiphilus fuscans]MBF9070907.1 branched-chain amino acid ABC transporter permease [Streptacidiphilus fuscans]
MHELPQNLANGLFLGAMYGLIAVGYTMVYGIIQLINFAHGEIFMTGAFGALAVWSQLKSDISIWLALPLMILGGVVTSTLVAVLAERFAYRPLRNAPRLAPLITAIGLSIFLQQLVWSFPGNTSARPFPSLPGGPYHLGSITFQPADIFVLVVAALSTLFLAYFVRSTRTGRAMQATSQDPDTARLMGIDTDKVIVIAFVLGAVFAALAGVSSGLRYGQIEFNMGFLNGLFAFTAAVLGGIGNIYGALLGGVVLGLAQTLTAAYVQYIPGMSQFGSQDWSNVWAFVILILVLMFRPQGLLGERVADRA